MRRRAEFNRFAMLLFCSLIPLGSLAPTANSEESKLITGQRQTHLTTQIQSLAPVIERQATTLFKNYNVCSPLTPKTMSWLATVPEAEDIVRNILECPAFEADCCIFHIFHDILKNLKSDIELTCGQNLTLFVEANIKQLHVTLTERANLYTCKNLDLLQRDLGQVQEMTTAHKKMYIWRVLQKYAQLMQNTTKRYRNVNRPGQTTVI